MYLTIYISIPKLRVVYPTIYVSVTNCVSCDVMVYVVNNKIMCVVHLTIYVSIMKLCVLRILWYIL